MDPPSGDQHRRAGADPRDPAFADDRGRDDDRMGHDENWSGGSWEDPDQRDGRGRREGGYSGARMDDGSGRSASSGRQSSQYTGQSYGQSGGRDSGHMSDRPYGPSGRPSSGSAGTFGYGPGVGSEGRYGDDRSWGTSWSDGASGRPRAQARPGPHAGKGPKGYVRSDDRIRDEASDELMADGEVNASDIEIEVTSGEVVLRGTVDSREAKRRAEELVETIQGVHNVQNALRVKAGHNGNGADHQSMQHASGAGPGARGGSESMGSMHDESSPKRGDEQSKRGNTNGKR